MFLIFQETSKLEQDVNCTVEDGTHPSITLTTNNVVTLGGKSESLDIPASTEPKPELPFDGDNAKTEQLISGDKEVSEPVATETEKPINVISNKSLSLETAASNNTQQIETSIKTVDGSSKLADSAPTMIKKCGRPPKAKSQEKKHVRVKQGSDPKSEKIDPHNYSGGRVTRRQTKNDKKYSQIKVAEGESVKQQKASLNPQTKDGLSNKDTDNDANLKVTQ
jgi:hypothetical protein